MPPEVLDSPKAVALWDCLSMYPKEARLYTRSTVTDSSKTVALRDCLTPCCLAPAWRAAAAGIRAAVRLHRHSETVFRRGLHRSSKTVQDLYCSSKTVQHPVHAGPGMAHA